MDPIKPYAFLCLSEALVLMELGRYLPAFGRFLIVVTFLEDALRIMTQFGDQIYYLITYRRFLPWGVAHIFLIVNVIVFPISYLFDMLGDVGWELYGGCT